MLIQLILINLQKDFNLNTKVEQFQLKYKILEFINNSGLQEIFIHIRNFNTNKSFCKIFYYI